MNKLIEDKVIKTEKVKWRAFKFLQKNTFKDISPQQMKKLKTSITNNDFVETFKVWENGQGIYCLDGYHRCLALSELAGEGYQVPDEFTASFIQCKDKKDAAKKVLIYSSQYASITDEGLYEFSHDFNINFEDIKLEIDIPKLDLDRYEAGYVNDGEYNEEEDVVPDPPKEATAKLGDLYLLGGRHRLLCGDATKPEDVARLMDGKKADMVFTDPPYGMNLDTDWSSAKSSRDFAEDKKIFGGKKYDKVTNDDKPYNANELLGIFKEAKEIFLWGADYYCTSIPFFTEGSIFVWDKRLGEEMDRMYGSAFELCWSKNKHKRDIVRIKWAGVFGIEQEPEKARLHPTQKPLELARWFLSRYSKENQNIWDGYGGSGFTLLACEQTNRTCFMSEIEPLYIDVIIERYKNLTGKDVELIDRIEK